MSSRARLWLGFGVLTTIILLSSVAIFLRVSSIDSQLKNLSTSARSRGLATRGLKSNALDFYITVSDHVRTPNANAQFAAGEQANRLERNLVDYSENTVSPEQVAMVNRCRTLWQDFRDQGLALFTQKDAAAMSADLERFEQSRIALLQLVDDQMQIDATTTYSSYLNSAIADSKSIVIFTSILAIGGTVIALLMSLSTSQSVLKNEKLIDQQREQLRTTLASIGDAVISTDVNGNVTYLNTIAVDLTGWTNEEARGRPLEHVFQIVNETTRVPVESPAHRALRAGVVVGLANHTILIAKDRSERAIDDSAAPIMANGEIVGCVLVFRDVSERRAGEQALAETLLRRDAMLAAGEVGTWEFDIVKNEVRADTNLANIFGVKAEDAAGGPLSAYTDPIHPEDRPRVVKTIGEALESGSRFEAEYRILDHHSNIIWVVAKGMIERDQDGAPLRMPGVVINITKQKLAEEQLRALAENLSQADRRKNEFLAMLAHELRNPLAPLRNGLSLLKMSNADEGRGEVDMMERQIQQMVHLVDDLMDISRISTGKIELRRKSEELQLVVQAAIDACKPAIEAERHNLIVQFPEQPVYINADAVRVTQIFTNLLSNACKYSEPDGQIAICVTSCDHEAIVSVKDSGMGIPPTMLEAVFQMFTQVDESLERAQGGLGIGLSLVKTLVELHGGCVTAKSEGIGTGSEFIVRLPIIQSPLDTSELKPQTQQATHSKRRILVVDDNIDAAKTLAMLLEIKGNSTMLAHDGQAAVTAAEEFKPEIVLLDIGLPKMNGYQVARAIRAQSWANGILLIALTGWGQEDDRRKSKEAGFDTHLVKPVDFAELTKLLA